MVSLRNFSCAYLRFTQLTSAIPMQSICASRVNTNRFYGTSAVGVGYSGILSGTTITWYPLSPAATGFSNMSCVGYLTPTFPSTVSSIVSFNNSFAVVNQYNPTILGLSFLSPDANNNLVYSGRTNTNLYVMNTTSGSFVTGTVSGVNSVFG